MFALLATQKIGRPSRPSRRQLAGFFPVSCMPSTRIPAPNYRGAVHYRPIRMRRRFGRGTEREPRRPDGSRAGRRNDSEQFRRHCARDNTPNQRFSNFSRLDASMKTFQYRPRSINYFLISIDYGSRHVLHVLYVRISRRTNTFHTTHSVGESLPPRRAGLRPP